LSVIGLFDIFEKNLNCNKCNTDLMAVMKRNELKCFICNE